MNRDSLSSGATDELNENDEEDNEESGNKEAGIGLFLSHSGESDYTVADFSVQQRVMHFLGAHIDRTNRSNVETCLLIEAGTAVINERSTTAEIRNEMMKDKYVNLVRQFRHEDFVSSRLQDDMMLKFFYGKSGGFTGYKLWQKFEECQREIQINYTPKLPKDISHYPSGH